MEHNSWHNAVHDQAHLIRVAEFTGNFCKRHNIKTVACMGVSGIAPSAVASALFNLNLVIARKVGEQTHASRSIQGPNSPLSDLLPYIILDDLIDSGGTVRSIISKMDGRKPEYILLYAQTAKSLFEEVPVVAIA